MSNSQTKKISWKTLILVLFGIGLLTAGLSVFLQSSSLSVYSSLLENTIYKNVGTGASFEVPAEPARLVIPAIGVDASIQKVGLTESGNMGIPTNFTDVAWYKDGVLPGFPGSAVITGHLDGKEVPEAVFYNLDDLKIGDSVEVIDQNNRRLQFKVVDKKIYDYDAATDEIFTTRSLKPGLNLITCTGSWIKSDKLYDKRVVVFTELD